MKFAFRSVIEYIFFLIFPLSKLSKLKMLLVTFITVTECNDKRLTGRGTGEKANHVPQPADHSGLNYTFGSLEDEAGTHRP